MQTSVICADQANTTNLLAVEANVVCVDHVLYQKINNLLAKQG